jgi:transcriptional regulator
MYVPHAFRENDLPTLHAMMREASFATVVTCGSGSMVASHLPLLVDETRGDCGMLLGHMARGNTQWEEMAAGREVLAIFAGPHSYVSPSWYQSRPAVPTWNYTAVHAYGTAQLIEDAGALQGLLERMVEVYESGLPAPWSYDLPQEYTDRLLRGIVGFEIEIARLEGKRKLGQNRSAEDRAGAAASLRGVGGDDPRRIADLMEVVGAER